MSESFWKQSLAGFDTWKCDLSKYYFDFDYADRICNWIEKNLCHMKGRFAGKPFILEDWQKLFFGFIFAWKRKSDNKRRFQTVFLYIPRKNGKSQMAAALLTILFLCDGEMGAQVFCAAADTDQANIVFLEARNMIQSNKGLAAGLKFYDSMKSIEDRSTNSVARVLSSEAGTKHGLNPHAYIVDEVHVQKNAELMETLETGTGTREQPLGIYLTTADYARESACNKMYYYSKSVRGGNIKDEQYLPVIFEAGIEDDWTNPDVWKKANPNYGVSVRPEYIEKQCAKAQNEPSFQNTFKRLHLNIMTGQETAWLDLNTWRDSGDNGLSADSLAGCVCYGGLDLSQTTDLSAFALWFPETKSCLLWHWTTRKRIVERLEYQLWVDSRELIKSGEAIIDYDDIRNAIFSLGERYQIKSIAYDRWGSNQISQELIEGGININTMGQGFASMSAPSKEFERLIVGKEITHFDNSLLAWQVGNVAIKSDPAGNIKPVKPERTSTKKIDGVVALIMAIGESMRVETDNPTSVYESRGVLVI